MGGPVFDAPPWRERSVAIPSIPPPYTGASSTRGRPATSLPPIPEPAPSLPPIPDPAPSLPPTPEPAPSLGPDRAPSLAPNRSLPTF